MGQGVYSYLQMIIKGGADQLAQYQQQQEAVSKPKSAAPSSSSPPSSIPAVSSITQMLQNAMLKNQTTNDDVPKEEPPADSNQSREAIPTQLKSPTGLMTPSQLLSGKSSEIPLEASDKPGGSYTNLRHAQSPIHTAKVRLIYPTGTASFFLSFPRALDQRPPDLKESKE